MSKFTVIPSLLVLVAWSACTLSTTASALPHEENRPHVCVHDELMLDEANSRALQGMQNYQHSGRRLQGTTVAPLRIVPIYLNLLADSSMTATLSSFIINTLMPAAIAKWASVLSVQPVQGALYAQRQCTSSWTSTTPARCASFATTTNCGGTSDVVVSFNSTYLGADSYWPTNPQSAATVMPAGAGLQNADFGVFVTAQNVGSCVSSSTLAYALTCQRDQFDRPTWGRINFCPGQLNSAASAFDAQLTVAVHELGHSLGFSSSSWPLWRNKDTNRTPMTARDPLYPSNIVSSQTFSFTCNSRTVSYAMPNTTIVSYFQERGMTCTGPTTTASNCVTKFVSPTVAAVSQWYFDCPTVGGAELENQDTTSCAVLGSHWEQRIFNTEVMAPYAMHIGALSALTLSVFDDSGWYTVNYSNADPLRRRSSWGYKQGCNFALQKCLVSDGVSLTPQGVPAHFGNTSRSSVCTTDRIAVGSISTATYSSALPSQYQYFSNPNVGGSLDVLDYCPFIQAYSNGLCSNAANGAGNAAYGSIYGAGSVCLESTLLWSGYSSSSIGAACYIISCLNATALTVTVGPRASGGANATVVCTAAGVRATVTGFAGVLTCPDPSSVCGSRDLYSPASVATATPSPSSSAAPSSSATPSVSISRSSTSTFIPSVSATASTSFSSSVTSTSSSTFSTGASPSNTASVTATRTPSSSVVPPSASSSATGSTPATSTRSPSPSPAASSAGPSPSRSSSVVASSSASMSSAASATRTASVTASTSRSSTISASRSASPSPQVVATWVHVVLQIALPAGTASGTSSAADFRMRVFNALNSNATIALSFRSAIARTLGVAVEWVVLTAATDSTGSTQRLAGTGTRRLQTGVPTALSTGSNAFAVAVVASVRVIGTSDADSMQAASAVLANVTSASGSTAIASALSETRTLLATAAGVPSASLATSIDTSQSAVASTNPIGGVQPTFGTTYIIAVAVGGLAILAVVLFFAFRGSCNRAATRPPVAAQPMMVQQQGPGAFQYESPYVGPPHGYPPNAPVPMYQRAMSWRATGVVAPSAPPLQPAPPAYRVARV